MGPPRSKYVHIPSLSAAFHVAAHTDALGSKRGATLGPCSSFERLSIL
jgi:hypothetical protein